MKKLQNNFTTPEQSKRLLELGVPADSTDCVAHIVDNSIDLYEDFYLKGDARISVINQRHTYTKATTLKDNEAWLDEPYPCWSVGRLIEIHLKCCTTLNQNDAHIVISRFGIETGGLLQNMYDMVGECALLGKYDFSKLDE